jgi:hypothetical protein
MVHEEPHNNCSITLIRFAALVSSAQQSDEVNCNHQHQCRNQEKLVPLDRSQCQQPLALHPSSVVCSQEQTLLVCCQQ